MVYINKLMSYLLLIPIKPHSIHMHTLRKTQKLSFTCKATENKFVGRPPSLTPRDYPCLEKIKKNKGLATLSPLPRLSFSYRFAVVWGCRVPRFACARSCTFLSAFRITRMPRPNEFFYIRGHGLA